MNIDSGSDYLDSYSDSGMDINDPQSSSNVESESEGDDLIEDIDRNRAEGPAGPNQNDRTKKLWKREGELWQR